MCVCVQVEEQLLLSYRSGPLESGTVTLALYYYKYIDSDIVMCIARDGRTDIQQQHGRTEDSDGVEGRDPCIP